jgi:hypothetical protein
MTTRNLVAILATSIIGFAAATASAQNPSFDPTIGQIIIGFKGINGLAGNSVEVAINTADTYRDATGNITGIANIGSLLTSTYGAGWYDSTDLFMGAAAVWSNANPPSTLLNLDPERTPYLSKARNSVGIEGTANSTINNITASTLGSASNSIISLAGRIEQTGTGAANVFNDAALTNTWGDQNVISGSGTQSTTYGVTGGISFRFGNGDFGYSIGNQEGGIDLYRFQSVNDIAGQYGEGGDIGVGEFVGTLTIDNLGNINFIGLEAIPEPSTALGLGATALLGMALRRRRTVVA